MIIPYRLCCTFYACLSLYGGSSLLLKEIVLLIYLEALVIFFLSLFRLVHAGCGL